MGVVGCSLIGPISPYTKYAKYNACLPDLYVLQGLVIIDKSCAYSWARFCTGSRLDPFTLSRDRCQRVMVKNCKKVQYCKPVFVSVGILCEKAQQHLLLCKKVFSTISKTDKRTLIREFLQLELRSWRDSRSELKFALVRFPGICGHFRLVSTNFTTQK